MFGGLLRLKDDFSSGSIYSSRRSFLKTSSKPGYNLLEPPEEFKTKSQMKRTVIENQHILQNKNYKQDLRDKVGNLVKSIAGISTLKQEQQVKFVPRNSKNRLNKKSDRKIVIEKFSSTDQKDWCEQHQAGCTFWVNKSTGEVSSVCPFLICVAEDLCGNVEYKERLPDILSFNESVGTGALVYNRDDIDDLFRILDNGGKGNSWKSAVRKNI